MSEPEVGKTWEAVRETERQQRDDDILEEAELTDDVVEKLAGEQ